ncbi:MAG: hypothetical protein LQ340_000573 [Diploschistes diacapsis]|nr:MAG: hypothetical protein LQ340_000573 [Diploschistes diacapsis]
MRAEVDERGRSDLQTTGKDVWTLCGAARAAESKACGPTLGAFRLDSAGSLGTAEERFYEAWLQWI